MYTRQKEIHSFQTALTIAASNLYCKIILFWLLYSRRQVGVTVNWHGITLANPGMVATCIILDRDIDANNLCLQSIEAKLMHSNQTFEFKKVNVATVIRNIGQVGTKKVTRYQLNNSIFWGYFQHFVNVIA